MNGVLKNLEPKAVFEYFERISQIPRGSGNEKAISDYLVSFAKDHNLEVFRDASMNVIIKKPATAGYENAPVFILQGHMDMVCEKNKSTVHDFEKDPIKLRIIDDMIYATDTTLGADNGIAVAMTLAILESKDIPHPAIEALFTTDEEVSMSGATNLDVTPLKGRLLVNLDSEEEGFLLVSSAGGTKAKLFLPIEWTTADSSLSAYRISVGGLKGGHSGMEINKGRGNANKLMGRVLNCIASEFSSLIGEINGGLKANAITRETDAVIFLKPSDVPVLEAKLAECNDIFRNELSAADPDVFVKSEAVADAGRKAFSKATTGKVIAALVVTPNGIQSMSMHIKDLVESSTNLGVVQTHEDKVEFINEIRSSVSSLKRAVLKQVEMIGRLLGGELSIGSDYLEWAYKPDSKLRTLFQRVYKEKYGVDAQVIALHAGLECGVLSNKIEGLDCISLGPNLYDVHTPNEHLSIKSTKNVWEYLLEVLKQANTI